MSGVLFINPSSGRTDLTEELVRLFAGHDIVECDPEAFADQVAEVVTEAPDFVPVAGGDGTIRTAAGVLRGGPIPLVVVPAGTRNHFAKSLGIDSLEKAVAAIDGQERLVDIADVNGSCFINNSSIGLYPTLVIQRGTRERHMPKCVANLIAAYEQLRHGQKVNLTLDGVQYRAWMAFVGNGLYGDQPFDLAERTSPDSNLLHVRIVRADGRLARLRVAAALLTGRLGTCPLVHTAAVRRATIGFARTTVEVALDGEVDTLDTPLHYESNSNALLVMVPSEGAPALER